jgi:hypothetical protein
MSRVTNNHEIRFGFIRETQEEANKAGIDEAI